ncbi:MAG: M23 family metallopeptidase [Bacteroidales bacterium]|nr:M23 family metallopeptidase [Bacteroidales bacterium]
MHKHKKRSERKLSAIACIVIALCTVAGNTYAYKKPKNVTGNFAKANIKAIPAYKAELLDGIYYTPEAIEPIRDTVEFDGFSSMPDEYDTWSEYTINPYDTKLADMKDSVLIDVSGYCPPVRNYITSEFGFRRAARFHYGIDIKLYRGDTVRCAFDGTVRITRYNRRGYGYFIVVRNDNGLETLYGHLTHFLVGPDMKVKAGDPIGIGGSTGRSSGYHLHFEIRYLGNPINPRDAIDFDNCCVKNNVLELTAADFAYEKEIAKIKYWTIRRGDTLGRIALRTGVSISKLCRLNRIGRKSILRIGKRIRYN